MSDDTFGKQPHRTCGGREVHSVGIVKKICEKCGREVEVPLNVTECPDCGGEMREV